MNKILVTPRSLTREGHPALDLLKEAGYKVIFSTPGKQPDEEELLRLLPGCIGMLAGVETISARVLEAAKGLKAISRNGTGVDSIDLEAAERLNIKILRAEGAIILNQIKGCMISSSNCAEFENANKNMTTVANNSLVSLDSI